MLPYNIVIAPDNKSAYMQIQKPESIGLQHLEILASRMNVAPEKVEGFQLDDVMVDESGSRFPATRLSVVLKGVPVQAPEGAVVLTKDKPTPEQLGEVEKPKRKYKKRKSTKGAKRAKSDTTH